jgi:hypothetical protein
MRMGVLRELVEKAWGMTVNATDLPSRLWRLVVIVVLAAVPTSARADDDPPIHERTVAPPNARYEIAHSTLMARLTFRLDRHTGKIDQLVTSPDGWLAWEPMVVLSLPEKTGNRPRFQLFMSGTLARITILLDTDNGKTWALKEIEAVDGEKRDLAWMPMSN